VQKVVSLKELSNFYIETGLDKDDLAEYLCISKHTLDTWEKYFHLFPENPGDSVEYYSKTRIEEYIKIKEMFDKGKSLKEIKIKLFNNNNNNNNIIINPFSAQISNQISNPISAQKTEAPVEIAEFDVNKLEKFPSEKEEEVMRPFLTLLNRANERVGELIIEKAKIIEQAATEKADLMVQVNRLKDYNQVLVEERQKLEQQINEKQYLLKKSFAQETSLAETLKTSQEMLLAKDKEANSLKEQIKLFETKIEQKNNIIRHQEAQINKMIEQRQTKRWWQIWK